jgi:hypothetical protein
MNRNLEWYIEWISTAILIVGVALTAYDIYPWNAMVCLAGNMGWFAVALYWRKWSLGVVQIIVSAIYIVGLTHFYLY